MLCIVFLRCCNQECSIPGNAILGRRLVGPTSSYFVCSECCTNDGCCIVDVCFVTLNVSLNVLIMHLRGQIRNIVCGGWQCLTFVPYISVHIQNAVIVAPAPVLAYLMNIATPRNISLHAPKHAINVHMVSYFKITYQFIYIFSVMKDLQYMCQIFCLCNIYGN